MGRVCDQVRVVRGVCAIALALVIVNLLTSCNPATTGATAPGDIDVLDKVRSLDIMPRQAQSVNGAQQNVGERGRAAVFEGTEINDVAEARPQPTASSSSGGGGYDLNFENTPIATVAKVMIGDILNVGYTIDPRVQGCRARRRTLRQTMHKGASMLSARGATLASTGWWNSSA